MFDITRITEAIGGSVGQASESAVTGGLMKQLSEAGLEFSLFEDLNAQEVADLLQDSGLDMTTIDIDSVAEMAGQFAEVGEFQSIGDFLAALTQRN